MSYSVISPFLVPPSIAAKKRVNIGDGFILYSIQKLLAPLTCEGIFTSRQPLSESDLAQINSTRFVILAGANQLHDEFSMLPKMTLQQLEKIEVPILPFGIGIHGQANRNNEMSQNTRILLREIHQRIQFSAWRCPRTVSYLTQALPELKDQALMAGCPVMYGSRVSSDLLQPSQSTASQSTASQSTAGPAAESADWLAHQAINRVVVTVTERDDFWARESATLAFVAGKFQHAQKVLSLHQDFFMPRWDWSLSTAKSFARLGFKRQYDPTPVMLRAIARKYGFKLFIPHSVEECFDFYQNTDLHIGSRLHAHLYFLSQRKPSFLTYVDDRCVGFCESLDFPICEVEKLDTYLNYDFSRCQLEIDKLNAVMTQFVSHLKQTYA